MKVLEAEMIGYCTGVKRAMDIVFEAFEYAKDNNLPCYVYGAIVHNRMVVEELERKGIKTIYSPKEAERSGVLVIRTHGITDKLLSTFQDSGFIIFNATCPVVIANQRKIRETERTPVVIGINNHAEVDSLIGSSVSDVILVQDEMDLDLLDKTKAYDAIVQTTFSFTLFEKIKKRAEELSLDIDFKNSICSSSKIRRTAVIELAKKVDAIIVVGDPGSANSRELFNLAKALVPFSAMIENSSQIPPGLEKYDTIGITAGASTPEKVYLEVEQRIRSIKNGRE